MRRGFSLIEVMVVVAVFAVVGAVALPSMREMMRRRAEAQVSGASHGLLHTARDTAYKELACVEVRAERGSGAAGEQLVAQRVPCLQMDGDAGVDVLGAVTLAPEVVEKLVVSGDGRVVFQPSGGLTPNSPPRVFTITMDSGREAVFEIQPALGSIRECKSYDPNRVPSCE